MSVWSWLKLTVSLWLLRKAFKLTGWVLLAAAARRRVAGDAGGGRRVPSRPGCAAGPRSGCAAPPPPACR